VIERIFQSSRFLVLVAVFASAVSSVLIYLSCLSILYHIVLDFFSGPPSTADQGKVLAVKLLKLLDLLLIGITLQVISVSLYRLFITPLKLGQSQFLLALHIKSFHDLKITLVQVAVVILVILFLEHTVESGASLETFYFGASIALMIAASTFAWRQMK
jgi:uncharacterized membrane protein YqhA